MAIWHAALNAPASTNSVTHDEKATGCQRKDEHLEESHCQVGKVLLSQ
jgi:hypothetical protein